MQMAKCKLQIANPNPKSRNPEIPKSPNPQSLTTHYPLPTIHYQDSHRHRHLTRELPKPAVNQQIKILDLVDIVAGGDGFSGLRGRGINPATGETTDALAPEWLASDGKYHRVADRLLVDGVFIPDGHYGPVQIDSVGHTFDGFSQTKNGTAGCIWAGGECGTVKSAPRSTPVSLPTRASEEFSYKYEMDQLPSDVSKVDVDSDGRHDFTSSGAVSIADGNLSLTDGYLSSEAPMTIWPGKFNFADGYTIEARVKVVSSFVLGPFALWTALPIHTRQQDACVWLNVGDNQLVWGSRPSLAFFACNTKDDYHVYRVTKKPGKNTYVLWRDGILVSSELPSGADTGGRDRIGFGMPSSEGWGGTALVDYVRFTSGAYAPPHPTHPVGDTVTVVENCFEVSTKLGGVDYNAPGRGGLLLYANAGITFDLSAIRRANPGQSLLRFRTVAGNTETVSMRGEAVLTDLSVIVDGQLRLRRREINGTSSALPIVVPLGKNDRFMTLVATSSSNSIQWNWILFGDPRLEMTPDDSLRGANLRSQNHQKR